MLPLCRERLQIVIFRVEWFGRLKWRETGLEASLSFIFDITKMSAEAVCKFPPFSPT